MKKFTSKWKSLNKNGLQLSLICGLNWLISFVTKGQFYLFSAAFLGILTYYLPQDYRVVTIILIGILVMSKSVLYFIQGLYLAEFRRIKSLLSDVILLLFFVAGNHYIDQHALTESMVNRLFTFWLISSVIVIFSILVQPKIFKHYLFKKVINKEYLGIRKSTDDLPPECNLYTDADEKDANKRMTTINQNAIKQPYQGVVELSFLNRKVITAIGYRAVQFKKQPERTFIDDDTIYYPIFTVHPFGDYEGKSDFYHTLIKFQLSRKAAFTAVAERFLK